MKVNCEIVQDLLPLYEDGICSESSRAAVEAHLEECENCRRVKAGVQAIPEGELALDLPAEEKTVAGGLRKVRRRWVVSLLAVLLVIPVLLLAVNQIRGVGVAFTSVDDILVARGFLQALSEGDYEKAADRMDYSALYQEIQAVQNITDENFLENTERVQIGDQVWYMDKTLADAISGLTDEMDIWNELVLNRHWGVMISEEKLQAVMDREGIVQEDTTNGYALSYSNIFRRLETPWGTYLAEDRVYQSFLQSEQRPVDYALYFGMIPEEMYLDIRADIESYAREMVAANEEIYGAAWNMTEEEFRTRMREKYIHDLESAFAQGLEITDITYYNSQRLGSGVWCVRFLVEVTCGDQRQEMMIGPDIHNGKVWRMEYSYTQAHDWQDMLMDALVLSYVD